MKIGEISEFVWGVRIPADQVLLEINSQIPPGVPGGTPGPQPQGLSSKMKNNKQRERKLEEVEPFLIFIGKKHSGFSCKVFLAFVVSQFSNSILFKNGF